MVELRVAEISSIIVLMEAHPQKTRVEWFESNENDQKENLLKVQDMKKQGKLNIGHEGLLTVGSGCIHEPNPCS